MRRVVLDTNVVLSAALSHFGPAAVVVGLVLGRRMRCILDPRILDEYEDVLTRPRFGLPRRDVVVLLEWLRRSGEFHPPQPLPGGRKGFPDPGDVMFLEVALGGKADLLVTRNLKHYPADRRHGIAIVTPEDVVGAIDLG